MLGKTITQVARNIQVFTYKIDLAISSLSNANKARHLYDVKLIKTAGLYSRQLALPQPLTVLPAQPPVPACLGHRGHRSMHAAFLPACLAAPRDVPHQPAGFCSEAGTDW